MHSLFFLSLIGFILICTMVCAVVLIQEGKSSGLGASFGGDPGSSLFGTSTADVLKKFTGWLVVLFFSLGIIFSLWTSVIEMKSTPTKVNRIEEIPG